VKTERSIRNDILGALVLAIPIAVLIVGGLWACGLTDDVVFTRADWADAESRVQKLDAHYREALDDLFAQYLIARGKERAELGIDELFDARAIDFDLADATKLEGRAVLAYFETMREAGDGNLPSAIDDNAPSNED
jgi:hypothetical protein